MANDFNFGDAVCIQKSSQWDHNSQWKHANQKIEEKQWQIYYIKDRIKTKEAY